MTMRSVDTRFWSDIWVRKLNALDRYAMLYFLTNDHTTWCGIYEVDLSMIAFESGIDKEDLIRSILPRLSPKIIYIDGWVYIQNFQKYHANKTESTQIGYERALKQVPKEIRLKIKEIEEIGVVPPTHPSFALSFALPLPKGEIGISQDIREVSESEKQPKEKQDTTYRKIFDLWDKYPANWRLNRTEIASAKNLLKEHGLEDCKEALEYYEKNKNQTWIPEILTPTDLDRKWLKLEAFFDKQHGKV